MTDAAVLAERDRAARARWPALGAGSSDVVATLGHQPGRLDRFVRWYEGVVDAGLTSRRLKDLVHRRVAELHELTARGALPDDPAALDPSGPPDLAADERALLRFIDAWAIDHLRVPDAVFAELHRHFPPAELTELLWTVAIARSTSRVAGVLHLPYAERA